MPYPLRPYAWPATRPQSVTSLPPLPQNSDLADLARRIETVSNDVRRALALNDRRYNSTSDRRRARHRNHPPTRPRRAVPPLSSEPAATPPPDPASHDDVVRIRSPQTTRFRSYANFTDVLRSIGKGVAPFTSLMEVSRDMTYLRYGTDAAETPYAIAQSVGETIDALTGLIPYTFIMQMAFDLPRLVADGLDGKALDPDQRREDLQNVAMLRGTFGEKRLVVRTRKLGDAAQPSRRMPFVRDEPHSNGSHKVQQRCRRGLACGTLRREKEGSLRPTLDRDVSLRASRLLTVPTEGVRLHRERPEDKWSAIVKVTARVDEQDLPVRFDPAIQGWRLEDGTSLARDKTGTWALNEEEPSQPASPTVSASGTEGLPPEALHIQTPRIPKLAERRYDIPPLAHQVWIGETMPETLVKNVIANARFLRNRLDYDSTLYIDAASKEVMTEMKKLFSGTHVKVKDLKKSSFYQVFQTMPLHEFYRRATQGPNRNHAMASDIIRYPLLYWHGGVYIDVDDRFIDHWAHSYEYADPINLAQNDMSFGRITRPEFLGSQPRFANTPLASHPNNQLLDEICDEMLHRLQDDPQFFDRTRPRATDMRKPLSAAERRYITKISHLTGLDLLTDVMQRKRTPWAQFATADDADTRRAVIGGKLGKKLREAEDYMMVFSKRIPVAFGNTHSWRRTRRSAP